MFSFAAAPWDVPQPIVTVCRRTWASLSEPGATLTGAERVGVAALARASRLGISAPSGAPDGALGAATVMLAATPARTERAWAERMVDALGAQRYVEVTGIVSRVIAIDTFCRLLGVPPERFPKPRPGDIRPEASPATARRGKAWIPMVGFPTPPNVLSLVPTERVATNAVAETLYMTGEQMDDPDTTVDGLHRTQAETVATTVSHGNECFY